MRQKEIEKNFKIIKLKKAEQRRDRNEKVNVKEKLRSEDEKEAKRLMVQVTCSTGQMENHRQKDKHMQEQRARKQLRGFGVGE